MATFSSTQYGIKTTGSVTNVPNNPISKLQYYLKTVLGLLQADQDERLDMIKNYQSNNISSQALRAVLQLAVALQPDIFLNKCIFVAPQLCGNYNNQFYQLSEVTNILGIARGIVIGGSNKKVKKIMACKKEWLINNYYVPLKQISQSIQQAEKRQKAQQLALMLASISSSPSRNNPEDCRIM